MMKIIWVYLFLTFSLLYADDDFNRAKIIALSQLKNNNMEEAVNAFKQYLRVHPYNPLAYVEIAQLYENSKDYDNATKTLLTGLANLPRATELYFKLSEIYFSLQDYMNAIKYLNLLISTCPKEEVDKNCEKAYKMLGIAYFLKNDIEHTILHLKKFITLKYNDPEAYKYLSLAYFNQNDDKSSAAYNEMNSLLLNQRSISYEDFYYLKGVILLKNALYQEALQTLIRVAENRRKDHKLFFNIGLGYLLIQEYPESILNLERGTSLYDQKKLNFKKWVRMDYSGGKYYMVLCLAYLLNKEDKKASLTFEKVQKYDSYFYRTYKQDYTLGLRSKLYSQLSSLWEE